MKLQHNLVSINDWVRDVRVEVPGCPVPVIEHNIRRACIEACERGQLVRDTLPEIPIIKGRSLYDLPVTLPDHCVHSVLRVCLAGRQIANSSEGHSARARSSYEPYIANTYAIPDRGYIELTRPPGYNSRFLGEPSVLLIEEPVSPAPPGEVTNPLGFTVSISSSNSNSAAVLSDDTLTASKPGGTDSAHLIIERPRSAEGNYYFEMEVTSNTSSNTFSAATGITVFPNQASSVNHLGGWIDSVGYHINGYLQVNDQGQSDIDAPAQVGDIIGVKVSITPSGTEVEFRVNDSFVANATLAAGIEIYPAVSLTGGSGFRYISGIAEPLTYLPDGFTPWDEGLITTQQDVDDYLLNSQIYQEELEAYNNQTATTDLVYKESEGLVVLASVKPSRDATEVSSVLHKDYFEVIRTGALSFLHAVKGKPWSDQNVSARYKREFEIELNRARQSIDRGFATKSHKIKPRRFV